MGLTSAMYTGLTGLDVNSARIETIGNNIANVNTHAFKSSRTLFQTLFSRTMSQGTAPGDNSGGTNPMQFGQGAAIATTQRTTTEGTLETTGLPSDIAIEGAGYFVVRGADGSQFYTRDGSFTLNANNQLVSSDGRYVQGFGVDDNMQIIPGTLTNLTIPLGQQIVARPTENVAMDGVLSAAERLATSGSVHTSQELVADGGSAATDATSLTDLRPASDPGVTLFADGDTITLSGVSKGERDLPTAQFVVGTTGSTLGDFAQWVEETLGIQEDAALAGTPGVTIENGQLTIRGNAGEPNAIRITGNDLVSSNATTPLPLSFTQTTAAAGSGVFTSFTVYDSLGAPVTVNATLTLDSLPATGPVWRYFLESSENGASPRALGTGTVAFDNEGNFVSATGTQFDLDRSGTGAASPLTFTLDLSALHGLATSESNVVMAEQDGYPPGTLATYGIGQDGTITGVFSNGISRPLGQVALAIFRNDTGLIAERENLFSVGPNSGPAQVTPPGVLGAGQTRGGALEMSNVDLTSELIGLVTSSTGYQAAGRVISVSSDMLEQLLLVLR